MGLFPAYLLNTENFYQIYIGILYLDCPRGVNNFEKYIFGLNFDELSKFVWNNLEDLYFNNCSEFEIRYYIDNLWFFIKRSKNISDVMFCGLNNKIYSFEFDSNKKIKHFLNGKEIEVRELKI